MSIKEYFKTTVRNFFIIVTLVNVATFLLGSIYQPEARFGYEAFLSPLVYGALSFIPMWIMYSPKELSVKQLLFREALQLVSLEVILILLGFGTNNLSRENVKLILSFACSVLVIYVLVHVISWLLDSRTAKIMTKELEAYQANN